MAEQFAQKQSVRLFLCKLSAKGNLVPVYFQIGFWPSVEMAIDYLAWGFFTGHAFWCVGLSGKSNDKKPERYPFYSCTSSEKLYKDQSIEIQWNL